MSPALKAHESHFKKKSAFNEIHGILMRFVPPPAYLVPFSVRPTTNQICVALVNYFSQGASPLAMHWHFKGAGTASLRESGKNEVNSIMKFSLF